MSGTGGAAERWGSHCDLSGFACCRSESRLDVCSQSYHRPCVFKQASARCSKTTRDGLPHALAPVSTIHVTTPCCLEEDGRCTTCWSLRQEPIEWTVHVRRDRRPDRDIADMAGADVQRQAPSGVQHQDVSRWGLPLSCRASCLDSRDRCSADCEDHLQQQAPSQGIWAPRQSICLSRRSGSIRQCSSGAAP